MGSDAAGGDGLESLFTRWYRIEELYSLGVGSDDVQRHLRTTMDELENRMLLIDPQRTAGVIAHHAATRSRRKAA
jgi:hypothetical protein